MAELRRSAHYSDVLTLTVEDLERLCTDGVLKFSGSGLTVVLTPRQCANLNCSSGKSGDRAEVPIEFSRKFCGKACRWDWNNKSRKGK